ncbi:MAG TPA: M23 family metallopeptidase, partial [Cyclobacteriaceae bacterium]|nr:M23 family metallopeptidase [Cyclobacteriaceae bacterium]
MKLSKAFFLTLFPLCALAQFADTDNSGIKGAATDAYLFPINPGKPNFLAGTMGELRNTHFHGGIDIRTNNRIGVPVLATQDGYISRANVSAFSYGTALFVTHPDGKTSVYGHLEKYKGKIAAYVKQQQYLRKSFEIDLNFKPGEFPVHKGDTIAFSGNTGSSSGPHLHFEIRDGNYVLNPLKFGFTEIKDNIAPAAQKIALRTLDNNARINDRFGRFEFSMIRKSANEFVLPVPILAHGRIGVELLADDRMDETHARCGINYIEMFVDSQKVFTQTIERVDLEETRGILALMDYKTLETKGKRYNKLYIDDGNRLDFYTATNEGVINVDDVDRAVRISLRDEAGNKSDASFRLKSSPVSEEMVLATKRAIRLEADLLENFLMITSAVCPGATAKLQAYYKDKAVETTATYSGANQSVFLIDLRKGQPDSVISCAGSLAFHFKDVVPSEMEYTYYSDWADIRFPVNSLYDTLFLNVDHYVVDNKKESFIIGNRTIPLHSNVLVTLKPTLPQTPAKNLAVYRREGSRLSFVGGEWSNGKVRFATRELGEFTFATDTVPPAITRIKLDRTSARFRVRDGLSGISYYEANINGEWLLM